MGKESFRIKLNNREKNAKKGGGGCVILKDSDLYRRLRDRGIVGKRIFGIQPDKIEKIEFCLAKKRGD